MNNPIKENALAQLAVWAEKERECHAARVKWATASWAAGATFTEMSTAAKLSRQGFGRAIKKLGIKVDNQAGEA